MSFVLTVLIGVVASVIVIIAISGDDEDEKETFERTNCPIHHGHCEDCEYWYGEISECMYGEVPEVKQ